MNGRASRKRIVVSAAVLVALWAAAPAPAVQPGDSPETAAYFKLARAVYSGERALETVAFLDRRWRLPGNAGFDAGIRYVEQILLRAGYRPEATAGGHPFTYRVEKHPMQGPAWDPVDASLTIVGEGAPLLRFRDNRNMIAINSHSTPAGGVEAPLVYVGRGRPSDFEGREVRNTIVMGDAGASRLIQLAVVERGALGVLSYTMPAYNRPEEHRDSIQFSRIRSGPERSTWALRISFAARERLLEALERGPVRARVAIETRMYESEELTLVADVRGTRRPSERFVFSAHMQEPGANDNASGVAAQAEMARTLAEMVGSGIPLPQRTITFIWGDEIGAVYRYLEEDPERAGGVRWGISLDMVGENTSVTGGTFLIEKMPDPSAVWTRGKERHTEWGGRPMQPDRLFPHYLNDFVLARCLEQGRYAGWAVETNPYEGGSDHVPFLRAGIPGLLLWHFTDEFYHTDGDRLDKVSPATLKNVGTSALVCALTLASGDAGTARQIIEEVERAAHERLETEFELSRRNLGEGGDLALEKRIVKTWTEWYEKAIATAADVEVGGPTPATLTLIAGASSRVSAHGGRLISKLEPR